MSQNLSVFKYIIIIIILLFWEIFTQELADCFSLAWLQVSSSLQDSSQYSGKLLLLSLLLLLLLFNH